MNPFPMPIKATAPVAGAKRNLADWVIEAIGPHRVLWYLCAASIATLLEMDPCAIEVAVDLHGDLTNLARVLQIEDLALKLYEKLNRTLMCDALFREACDRYRLRGYELASDAPDWERAYDYFICSWQGRNGVAGTKSYNQGFCARYASGGGHQAKRWTSAIASIPAWHWRLTNVTILRRDIFEEIPKIHDEAGTVVYADPPYIEKGFEYVHDFPSLEQEREARAAGNMTVKGHIALAEELVRFQKARVVISYYDHPKLAELYPGWERRHRKVPRALRSPNLRGGNHDTAVEVLLINNCGNQAGLFT